MNRPYFIKLLLSLIALSLWIASLLLPVFEEGGAGSSHSGGWVLLLTFTWGILYGFGIPWAVMNVGLFVLMILNFRDRRSERLAIMFLVCDIVVTTLTAVLAFLGVGWRYGVFLWIGSMYLMGFAALIDHDNRSQSARLRRAT